MNWYMEVLKKYAVFSGRARRAEYWNFALFNAIIVLVLEIPLFLTVNSEDGPNFMLMGLVYLYTLAVFLPSLGVYVRRLHDTGKSGWYLLWGLLPFIGAIMLLIALVSDSQPGDNKYGPNPKETPVSVI